MAESKSCEQRRAHGLPLLPRMGIATLHQKNPHVSTPAPVKNTGENSAGAGAQQRRPARFTPPKQERQVPVTSHRRPGCIPSSSPTPTALQGAYRRALLRLEVEQWRWHHDDDEHISQPQAHSSSEFGGNGNALKTALEDEPEF
ncbi:hypothetical protein E2562_015331 [Oryza meyeriana var. granulata]|uniref:Uncharacterized protein n=1 Tax=Oryza meyeriana var. granulata TaxID=110450 RepID=A0A6G1EKS5_9ORYZ|nr:hypothetical protein E2562_015331 [Oryza meyeriana var. granulata]